MKQLTLPLFPKRRPEKAGGRPKKFAPGPYMQEVIDATPAGCCLICKTPMDRLVHAGPCFKRYKALMEADRRIRVALAESNG